MRVEAPATATALSADRIELARRFIALSQPADNVVEAMRAGFWHAASQYLEDEAQRSAAEKVMNRMFARFEPKLQASMPAILEAYAQVYAREFSADELQHMIAFAESPAGRRYLTRIAVIESDEALMDAQAELLDAFTPILEEMQKEMCAEQAAKRIAAGDTKAKCPLSLEPETRSS